MDGIVSDPVAGVLGGRTRLARYGGVTLDTVAVRLAVTEEDFAIVGTLRRAGFCRVSDADPDEVSWIDEVDRSAGTFSLIASVGGEDIGTMRVQDGRWKPVELAKFINFMPLLMAEETPVIQGARLSMKKTPRSAEAMMGLFKAVWGWCYRQELGGIVIATPIWSKPIYDFMAFRNLGSVGEFAHPFVRKAIHYTMALQAQNLEEIWRAKNHPLCSQFFDIDHPNLLINPPIV